MLGSECSLVTQVRLISFDLYQNTEVIVSVPKSQRRLLLTNLSLILCRMGEITIELYWKHAPNTCRNFAELVRRGYYNNTIFHRIIRDFMIQGGDPTGTGRGGTSIYGPTFSDEINSDLKHTGYFIELREC